MQDLSDLLKNFEPKFTKPSIEITFPIREKDCPAAPVCESIGNLRKECLEGNELHPIKSNANPCTAGLILLLSFAVGMWPEQKIEELQEKRKIGFVVDGETNQNCL